MGGRERSRREREDSPVIEKTNTSGGLYPSTRTRRFLSSATLLRSGHFSRPNANRPGRGVGAEVSLTDEIQDSGPSTSAIDDMVEERMGIEPSATTEPVEAAAPESSSAPVGGGDGSVAEPVQSQAAVAPSEPNAPVATQPTPQTYRIGDKDYTAQELQAAMISAQQLPHLQKKYVDLLEQGKQAQQQPQSQPQGQPQQPAPKAVLAQIRAKYDPEVQQLVKDGVIEQDFATLFPDALAQMLMYRDGFSQLAQKVGQVESQFMQTQQREQSTGIVNDIGRSINALANSGEAFAPLKDSNQVQAFFQYLWDLNPQMNQVRSPDFLARQWVAYNKDQFLQNAQMRQQQQMQANQRRLAMADASTGTRGSGSLPQAQPTPLEDMVADFWQRQS